MGQVFRARDTRLDRAVAIKVLKDEFAGRFEREARAISALNHPNVCTLYDVGANYLVMELVEGATLAERLKGGAVALEEALEMAWQIAGGLEAAHERGIIHRDLKPANIKITLDGAVKVLDFGLAKPTRAAAAPGTDSTQALTMTEAGTVLGTASYMAPEQARGAAVDKRADIWAFGVVLYEMVTGERLFRGDTVTDTLAAVLTREPEWSRVPPKVERLLRRCLERDPRKRLRDIGDARFLVEDEARGAAAASRSGVLLKIGSAALALGLAAALVFAWGSMRRPTPALLRLSVDLGEDAAVGPTRGTPMALSPDGSRLVFVTRLGSAKPLLAVRRLDQPKSMPLGGTEGAEAPFFSPDGKAIGFFADGKLKKIDAAGGASVTLCDAPSPREGSWGDDDNIVFAGNGFGGLWRIAASGGTPQPATLVEPKQAEYSHRFPQVLPGARAVLFANSPNGAGEGSIEALPFQTGKRKILVTAGAYGHYLPSGHLVYMHGGRLFAAPMDVGRLELTGAGVPVLDDVAFRPSTGAAGFTFSPSGMFVYVADSPEDRMRPIGLMDETGKVDLLPVPPDRYVRARVSPDGKRLAVAIEAGAETHIWMYEWGTQRFARFVFLDGNSTNPVWGPDGKYLVFSSDAQTPGPGMYWIRTDVAGEAQRLVEGAGLVPSSSSASAGIIYGVPRAGVWRLPVDWRDAAHPKPGVPERVGEPLMETPAAVSPDGRWMTYVNGQSGSGLPEVFVRPFPGPGGPWQISTGGTISAWSRAKPELFYLDTGSRIKVTGYTAAADSFAPAKPRAWNPTRVERFDLMPDGKHAIVIPAAVQKEATHATFLLNFMDDLRRRVPRAVP
jgi:predicted Ser/Thr protein kinase